tara:strand:+ start:146 stop:4399 length:4254 start_codon:yes stop_codon:yes gene_type:complete
MANKFKGFNNQQTHQLLSELGYTGPAQQDEMDNFLAATPSAASMLGRYTEMARQRIEGQPIAPTGMQAGGTTPDKKLANTAGGFLSGVTGINTQVAPGTGGTGVQQEPDYSTYFGDQGEVKNIEVEKAKEAGKTELSPEIESQTQNILKMATGLANPNLEFDFNKDGKITSQDALMFAKDAKTKADAERAKQAEIGSLTARLQELQGLPIKGGPKEGIDDPIFEPQVIVHFVMPNSTNIQAANTPSQVPEGAAFSSMSYQAVVDWIAKNVKPPVDEDVERPIIQPGDPDPKDAPKEIAELDTAQTAYADAQKKLTDAQVALNDIDVEALEVLPFESEEDLQTIAENYLDIGKVSDEYGFKLSNDEASNTPISEVKALLESGKLPLDPTKYDKEELDKGSPDNWTFKYDNGQTITIRRNDKDDAIADFNNLAKMLGDFKDTDTFKDKPKSESEIEYTNAVDALDTANEEIEKTKMTLDSTESRAKVTGVPSVTETLAKTISSPTDLVTRPDVYGIKVENNQFIDASTGQLAKIDDIIAKQAELADAVDSPSVKTARGYLAKFSDAEIQEKYGPVPTDPEALAGYQARIEADARKDLAVTYEASMSQDKVKSALAEFSAKTGTPSDDAIMKVATMDPQELAQLNLDAETESELRQIKELTLGYTNGEFPEAATFEGDYTKADDQQITDRRPDVDAAKFVGDTPKAEAQVDYNLPPAQAALAEITKVEEAARFATDASAPEKQTEFVPDILPGAQTVVGEGEIVEINEILNDERIVVTSKTLEALNGDAVAKAASATFTQTLEAKFAKGDVSPQATITFQLEQLMDSFNDGTPAWAAGAIRNVNEAMNARGMGGSSMAAAALIQAAMETTLPIAQAEASIFQAMDMENVRNKQAVALANAAAAQRFELQNLDNRQAVSIQNSMNNSNLQLTNLSNQQEAVLSQAQLNAGLRNQELSVSQNVAMANAARYAEVNNINLTNRQQAQILEANQKLEVDLTNLSNRQQTALSNLQVKASMMGQVLTNEQQVAVLTSTQAFEREMENTNNRQQAFIQDANAMAAMEGRVLDNRQQTSLFNISSQLQEREIDLNNEQQIRMFNMTNALNIDVENLSNRQQTALANAQIEAAMKGQELTNKQQANVIKAERIAEIANMNFTAETSRRMQNSQLAQTVDLANLNNKQAKLMADAAALTQVDLTNLSNNQQTAQQKAQAFLGMDMKNLDNEQQMEIFKAQQTTQSIFSDQAADNAAKQFNAESQNQMTQFSMNLDAQVEMFNNAQANAMEQFNVGEENSVSKFNQEMTNQRDMFNASNEMVIAQANTQWRKDIATIDNAAINEANMREAAAANNLTAQGIAEVWQQERDLMNYAWTTAEKQADRDHELVKDKIQVDAGADNAFSMAAGSFLSATIGAIGEAGGIGGFFN